MRPTALGAAVAGAGAVHAVVNAALLRRPVPVRQLDARVTVLIPARDEADVIGACVDSALAQGAAEVLVLDDRSTDATAEIAAAHGARVLRGTAPPPGALGKPHACAQLAAAADPDSDILVFLDADVVLAPGAIGSVAKLLDTSDVPSFDLVSPHPRQVATTWAERVVQPLLQWSILTFLPLRLAERSSLPSLSAANGQFLLVRRDAYVRAGGHRLDAVLDDLELARAVKRSGGRCALVDGSLLASCRMYAGWPALRDGYAKSLWCAFGPPPRAAALFATLALAYVLPAAAALRGSRAGLAGYLAGVTGRAVAARATGGRVWPDALAQPASILLAGYLTARSHVFHRRGALLWKGRDLPHSLGQ